MTEQIGPRSLVTRLSTAAAPRFSICTMVTDWAEYGEFQESMRLGGFDDARCEYLVGDNTAGNKADAYQFLNEFLQSASGELIILCHHDILLLADNRDVLEARLAELDRLDPAWALAGNAGASESGAPLLCLADPNDTVCVFGGPFPQRSVCLDENFIVVRREANLALSRDLSGFHHYAADLCTIADILGWHCYVIDFFLLHKSAGTINHLYDASYAAIAAKYRRAFRRRWLALPTQYTLFLSGSAIEARLQSLIRRWLKFRKRYMRNGERYAENRRSKDPRYREALARHKTRLS